MEPTQSTPVSTGAPPGPPILSKAVASMLLGYLSIPACFCFGVPSLIFGGLAIGLGIWVQKHYTGNTASEFANVGSWMGMIAGGIGLLLGLIMTGMLLFGTGVSVLDAISR